MDVNLHSLSEVLRPDLCGSTVVLVVVVVVVVVSWVGAVCCASRGMLLCDGRGLRHAHAPLVGLEDKNLGILRPVARDSDEEFSPGGNEETGMGAGGGGRTPDLVVMVRIFLLE